MAVTLSDLLNSSKSLKGTPGTRPGGRNKEVAMILVKYAESHNGVSVYWGTLENVYAELIQSNGYPINRDTKEWRQRYNHYKKLGIDDDISKYLADLDIMVKNLRIRSRRDDDFPITQIRSEPRYYNGQYYYLIYFTPR